MPTALLVVCVALGALTLAFAAAYWLTTRRNQAGIVTSRLGRALRLWRGALRMGARWTRRFFRRLVTPKHKRAELDRRFHDETARAALETMGNMKGALMKLGQIVSFMDETLPPEYQEHLRALQCNAPPMSYEMVVRVLHEELGHDPERLFSRFDETPLAAASIGQVHRACTWDGTDVAVKVQYPGVDRAIAADLENAGLLVSLLGAVTPTLDAAPIAEELRSRLIEELDYEIEARNQSHFRSLYEGHPDIVVPKIHATLSSKRVLTSEFVSGTGFYDFAARATDAERHRAVIAMHTFVFDSMFHHHVFNGDPHPGNYLFLDGGRVAFLDFGCVKHFDKSFMRDFRRLNATYLLGDRDGYYEQICAMGFVLEKHSHKVDRDWLWEWARWFYEPILRDEPFRFTADYCRKSLSTMFGENMRKMNMPGEYLLLNRITFGLNSVLAKLGACENWHRLSMRHYFPELPVEEASAKVMAAVHAGQHG
jgi:predicted unusual protein kinase regulating ubiquinone biosynthesis (AarF/ABC1/UbiB family)